MPKKNHTKNTCNGQDYISPNAAWWFTWYIDNIMAYVLVTKAICLIHPAVVNPSSVGAGRLMKVLCRMTSSLAVTATASNEVLNHIVTITMEAGVDEHMEGITKYHIFHDAKYLTAQ